MVYIKVFDADDREIGVERIELPVYVRWQASNNYPVRCDKADAQGIVSENDELIYLLNGSLPHGYPEPYAVYITKQEYDEKMVNDPEDNDPVIPEDTPEEEPVLTRAELSRKVAELEEQNSFLTDCILEMSEVVYA